MAYGVVESVPGERISLGETQDGDFEECPGDHDNINDVTPFAHVEGSRLESDLRVTLESSSVSRRR